MTAPRYTGPTAVADASAALRAGRMVLVVGEADGAFRGDLVLAAEHVTAASVNAVTTLARGLPHVAMRSAALDALGIPPADPTATGPGRDMFRVSVALAGPNANRVSASGRAKTIRALADPTRVAAEFQWPGHIFPLGCAADGVLSVAATPEAAVDLVEQAGMAPAALLCEVCDADGEAPDLSALRRLAVEHDLPVVFVKDLLAYRRRALSRVTRRGEARIPLAAGEFRAIGFTDGLDREHIAFVHGDLAPGVTPLVRLHFECILGDVLGSGHCRCRARLEQALHSVAESGCGALIYVRARTTAVRDTLCVSAQADPGAGAAHPVGHSDLQSAFDILDELGMREIRLLADTGEAHLAPEHVHVVESVPLSDAAIPHRLDPIGSIP
ncbi:3,4-dihydroxy-2-butanone-4-phosphate synthase [Nocardia bovistercoris]|uniref:3,4-dihydroxy-2-butanone-4-phosphate synthase n=1 Tax=Nocardia bovistercoris TaxID=2785916 RepID=A0A931IIS1_9NOCA|nr:3,4-dihydroxy-2-butanone-4-phosphate synthase [Nocardia bovistercoris]MBH0781095.1 3,4-dihydroxy-2-butanone-4-phosphate synthase [Nocardia bovistercoris]